ncbi:MAG: DUF6765 family protein [Pyrinomonadaceae bacterium]
MNLAESISTIIGYSLIMHTKLKSKLTFTLVIVMFNLIFAQTGFAYDDDTHFWLTYYLARKSGYTQTAASQVAAACISVDYDPDTEPAFPAYNFFRDFFNFRKYQQMVRTNLHALPDKQKITNAIKRLDPDRKSRVWDPNIEIDDKILAEMDRLTLEKQETLWANTVRQSENPGVFLHYLQDKFTHRGFASVVGHAGYFYVDHIGRSTENTKRMARATVAYLLEFRKISLERSGTVRKEFEVLENQLDSETWNEIDSVIDELGRVNESPTSILGNRLRDEWNDNGERRKVELLRIVNEIRKDLDKRPKPKKAEDVVTKALANLDGSVPAIWFFDLRQNGYPAKARTSRILRYGRNAMLEPSTCRDFDGRRISMPFAVSLVNEPPRIGCILTR